MNSVMERKARFETRLDSDTHARLRKLAEEAGVSMNQVIEGVLLWAATKAYAGLPAPHENGSGYFESVEAPAVWFGFDGFTEEGEPVGGGEVLFVLDFSPGRAVIAGKGFLRG